MEQKIYERNLIRNKRLIIAARFLILFSFILIWEFASRFGIIDSFFFSSPTGVIESIHEVSLNGGILVHTGVTLYETMLSFVLTVLVSVLIAILLWIFSTAAKVFEPFLVALNSLPKSALAPLLIVWLGTGSKTIIIAGMSVAIFGSIINLYYGFKQSDEESAKLIYTLGGTKKDVLLKIILPGCVPVILSNMKVNIGLCLVGVIIGEFLAARRGLGYIIIYSTQVFKLDWLIMSILILCFIALILYFILQFMEKKLTQFFMS
ncbi:MAG: ABC transporter permease [Lachnospiraceae bacterium]|nr:ABC transporter permease [Lachnospiraceae bacterium]